MADDHFEPTKYIPADQTALEPFRQHQGLIEYRGGLSYGESASDNVDSGTSVRRLWQAILRRKWLIVALVFFTTSVAAAVMYQTESTYEASSMIELDEHASLMKADSFNSQDPQNFSLNLNTKKLIVRSHPILVDVASSLRLNENPDFLPKKKSIKDTLWRAGGGSRAAERIGELPPAGDLSVSQSGGDPPAAPVPVPAPVPIPEGPQLAKILKVLEDNLVVDQVRDARVLKVSFTHTDPKLAAAVANSVAQNFIQRSFRLKTEKFNNTAAWLERSTQDLRAKVKLAEEALANYVREHKIFSISDNRDKGTLATEKLAALHEQVMRAETDRTLKQSLYAEVKAGRTAQLPEAFTDAKIVNLQKELGELSRSEAQLSTRYGPLNLKLKEVQQQIASIREQIEASQKALESKLQADYERAVRDEQSLKTALARSKDEAVDENQESIQYHILKQDVETANTMYKDFLNKSNQASVQVAEQYNDIRVIEPAEIPTKPTGPKRGLVILTVFLLSLMTGVGLAVYLEGIDNTIRSVDDVKRYAQLPALGVIASLTGRRLRLRSLMAGGGPARESNGGHGSRLLLNKFALSPMAEAYLQLRTSVMHSMSGRMVKTLLVTSSLPGEGKTTTAANLAASLARTGASVLLVDADLRRPNLHRLFEVDNNLGLSMILSNPGLSKPEALEMVVRYDESQLFLLTSGPVPPNPAELLGSEQMRSLLTYLKGSFAYIIIDSPPIAPFTDGVLLSPVVDGVLLVVEGGKSSREAVQRSRDVLSSVGAKILGAVLNQVDLSSPEYYYQGYRYEDPSPAEAETEETASGI